MCVGKAFASLLPMAATLATERIFDAFRGGSDRALYYGHTFCGHALGAALAREVLAIYRDEDILGQVARKAPILSRGFARIAAIPGVRRVRTMGMIGAADLAGDGGYLRSARGGASSKRLARAERTFDRSETRFTSAHRSRSGTGTWSRCSRSSKAAFARRSPRKNRLRGSLRHRFR